MAASQNKIKINIDFNTQTKLLDEANKALSKLIENNTLISKQGNTIRSAWSATTSLFNDLATIQKTNGTVTVTELKNIGKEFQKVTTTIDLLVKTEEAYRKTQVKALDETTKKIQEKQDALEKLKKVQEEVNKKQAESYGAQKPEDQENMLKKRVAAKLKETGADPSLMSTLKANSVKDIQEWAGKSKKGASPIDKEQIELARKLNEIIKEQTALLEAESQATLTEAKNIKQQVDTLQNEIDELNQQRSATETSIKQSEATTKELTDVQTKLQDSYNATIKQRQALIDSGNREAKVSEKASIATGQLVKNMALFKVAGRIAKKALKDAYQATLELDKAITDMSIVTGESRDTLYKMVPALAEVGRECGSTITEVASLTAEYMKQGRTMQESIDLASETAKAAKIAGISVQDSVQYMTSAINGFNLAVRDASRVSDIFAKVAATSATDYEDLAIALSKVSAQANTAGMSIEFTTALLAKGIETTQEAPESIGTALKTVLARMRELSDYGTVLEDGASVNKVERALATAGVALRDTNGQFRDMEEIFNELGPKWDTLNTMQQQNIAQAVAGTRQQSRFLAIMQDWDRTMQLSADSMNAAGAAQYQYSQYTQSLEYHMTNLSTAYQKLIDGLVDSDAIKVVLDIITGVVNGLGSIMQMGDGLVGVTLVITGALMGIKAAWTDITAKTNTALNDKVNMLMTAQGLNREEALVQLQQQKQLTTLEKITAQTEIRVAKEKELLAIKEAQSQAQQRAQNLDANLMKRMEKFKNQEGKLDKEKLKNALAIVKTNKNLDGRSKNVKQFAQQYNMTTKDTKKTLEGLVKHKETLAELENEGLVKKMQELGVDAADVILEKEKADCLGVELTTEHAILLANQANAGINAADLAGAIALAQAKGVELTDEELINLAKIKKLGLTTKEAIAQGLITKERALELGLMKKSLGMQVKELAGKIKTAIVNIVSGMGSIISSLGVYGIPVAVAAGAALTAMIGAAAISISDSAGKNKSQEANNKVYENTAKKDQIKSDAERFKELSKKGSRTSEEEAELQEVRQKLIDAGVDMSNGMAGIDEAVQNRIEELDKESADVSQDAQENLNKLAEPTWLDELKENLQVVGGWFQKLGEGIKWLYDTVIGAVNGFLEANPVIGKIFNVAKEVVLGIINPIRGVTKVVEQFEWLFSSKEEREKRKRDKAVNAANEVFTDETHQTTMRNAQVTRMQQQMRAEGKTEEEIAAATSSMNDVFNNVNWDQMAAEAYDAGFVTDDGTVDIEAYMNSLGDAFMQANATMAEAADESLAEQIEAYNNASDQITSEVGKEAFANSNYILDLLKDSSGVIKELNGAVSNAAIQSVAEAANNIGLNSEQIADVLSTMGSDEDYAATLESMLSGDYFEKIGKGDLSEAERQKFINEYTAAYTGMSGSVDDFRTQVTSRNDNAKDVMSRLGEGPLSAEDQKYLREEFGDLYLKPEFQESLKNGGVQAKKMMREAMEKSNEEELAKLDNKELTLNTETQHLEDQLAKATTDEERKEILARIEANKLELQSIQEAREEIQDLTSDYAKLDEERKIQERIALSDQLIASAQKEIDLGKATAETYNKINKALAIKQELAQVDYDTQLSAMAKELNMTEEEVEALLIRDELTGEIVVNTEAVGDLDAEELDYLLNSIDGLEEKSVLLAEIGDQIDENNKAEREAQIEIQNQAIEAMKARLETEYEATKESLDKRRELYSKYFDALSAEEDTADYEADRQALLNKIASLSTATDSESLAKLKEAQEALAALDDEQLQAERDLRREAVEESFDKQGEELDAAYENAMADVQGMWEEFCTMAGEDQLALFQQYGEGFQEVTDLQKEMAMETLQATMDAIASYGYNTDRSDGEGHKYAEGGLVNYTGPAWVDGTPSKPEAFLDAVDTANIANLAQGLRAMMTGSFGVENSKDNNTVTINELNINVNGGADGQAIGQGAADGFMKAIRDLGININKQG